MSSLPAPALPRVDVKLSPLWAIFANGSQLDARDFASRADTQAAFEANWAAAAAEFDGSIDQVEFRYRFVSAMEPADDLVVPVARNPFDNLAVASIDGQPVLVRKETVRVPDAAAMTTRRTVRWTTRFITPDTSPEAAR